MALTITSEPYSIESFLDPPMPPVPVSDCFRWCLQADASDAVTTPGAYAEVEFTIPTTCTVPANGTILTIWGYEFEVDDSVPFTGQTFEVDTVGLTTVMNLVSMIQSNLFFNDSVVITVTEPGNFVVTLTWRECREQPRFVAEQMVFTAIDDAGGSGTFTNGTSPEYVEGYKIVTRIGTLGGDPVAFQPLSPKVGLTTDQQCTTVGAVCVDYVADAETLLHTLLPELTNTSTISPFQNSQSLMRVFQLEYGWVYRDNCQAKSGTILKSGFVFGINAAFDIDDEYQMRRYWYDHPDGYPPGQFVSDFLTTQPKKSNLCWDSFAWLWLLNSWKEDYPDYNLLARFVLYDHSGTIIEIVTVIIADSDLPSFGFQYPICFNISPGYVLAEAATATQATLARYDVQVVGVNPVDTDDVLFNATEFMTYYPGHCCDEKTDLYVLTPPGGFATQVVEVLNRSVVKEGQEVNLHVACSTSRTNKAKYGGRTIARIRAYEKIDFVFRMPNTPESVRWMKHIRQSPQTMIKTFGEGIYSVSQTNKGTAFAKKFIIDLDTVTTFVVGEGLEFSASGYTADIPTQKGFEP